MRVLYFGGAIAACLSVVSPVLAADIARPPPPTPAPYYAPPPVPVYNWGGFYFGINGGYGFANGSRTVTLSGNAFVDGTGTESGHLNGFVGGGQIGANWQWDAVVLGIEADFQGTAQSNTENVGCGFDCIVTEDIKIPWFATARARAGIAIDRILVYGTGGAAWMNVSDKLTAAAGGVSATLLDLSTTKVGWTAGAGVEVALAQNWTARVEYLFMDVTPSISGTVPSAIGGGTITENGAIKDNVVRAAVNFKFTP